MNLDQFVELFKDVMEMNNQKIEPDDKFKEYDDWDSLAVLSILAMVNQEFDIVIPRREFESVNTIRELYVLILSKI